MRIIAPGHFCATVVFYDPPAMLLGSSTPRRHQGGQHHRLGGRHLPGVCIIGISFTLNIHSSIHTILKMCFQWVSGSFRCDAAITSLSFESLSYLYYTVKIAWKSMNCEHNFQVGCHVAALASLSMRSVWNDDFQPCQSIPRTWNPQTSEITSRNKKQTNIRKS